MKTSSRKKMICMEDFNKTDIKRLQSVCLITIHKKLPLINRFKIAGSLKVKLSQFIKTAIQLAQQYSYCPLYPFKNPSFTKSPSAYNRRN